jgi:hypothetical protein
MATAPATSRIVRIDIETVVSDRAISLPPELESAATTRSSRRGPYT